MYRIDPTKEKPDSNRLKTNVEKMMHRGIKIGNIDKLEKSFSELYEVYRRTMSEDYGINNPNSSAQIANFLEQLSTDVPLGEKNDIIENCYIEGKWTSEQSVLNKLSALGYAFADDLLEYRKAKKNLETIRSIKKWTSADSMIHPSVSLTKTNRISYKDPALMNIPKELIWSLIEPINKGDELYSVDIKNQEPAILINALGDKQLIDALKSDEGLYDTLFEQIFKPFTTMSVFVDTLDEDKIYSTSEARETCFIPADKYMPMKAPCISWYIGESRVVAVSRVCQGISSDNIDNMIYPERISVLLDNNKLVETPVEWVKTVISKDCEINGNLKDVEVRMSKQERKEFKTSFLAITYGASSMGIEKQCKILNGNFVYNKITKIEKMAEYRKKCGDAARHGVQEMYTIFGNKVRSDKYGGVQELKRSLLSIPIQGTGADILDLLVNHFNEKAQIDFSNDKPFIYYTRHDELIIEVPKETSNECNIDKWLNDTLEHCIGDWVPFRVEINKIENIGVNEIMMNNE